MKKSTICVFALVVLFGFMSTSDALDILGLTRSQCSKYAKNLKFGGLVGGLLQGLLSPLGPLLNSLLLGIIDVSLYMTYI